MPLLDLSGVLQAFGADEYVVTHYSAQTVDGSLNVSDPAPTFSETVYGSLQPAPRRTQETPEGEVITAQWSFYTTATLSARDVGVPGDTMVIDNEVYRVVTERRYFRLGGFNEYDLVRLP